MNGVIEKCRRERKGDGGENRRERWKEEGWERGSEEREGERER